MQIRSKFSRFGPLAVIAGLLSSCLDFNAMAQEVPRPTSSLDMPSASTRAMRTLASAGSISRAEIMAWPSSITAEPSKRPARTAQPGSVSRPLTTAGALRLGGSRLPARHLARAKTISSSTTGAIPTSSEATFVGQDNSWNGPCCLRPVTRRSPITLRLWMPDWPISTALGPEVPRGAVTLARFPITWNQSIEKEALEFKDLAHVGIEKVEQLLRDLRPRSLRFLVPTVSWVTNSF